MAFCTVWRTDFTANPVVIESKTEIAKPVPRKPHLSPCCNKPMIFSRSHAPRGNAYEFKLNASDMGSHAEHGNQNKNPVTRCCQTVNHNSKRRHRISYESLAISHVKSIRLMLIVSLWYHRIITVIVNLNKQTQLKLFTI